MDSTAREDAVPDDAARESGAREEAARAQALLEVRNLKKYFPIEKGFFKKTVGYIKAVDDVSLSIGRGEALGLVGESGCGKTTLGRCILRAVEPTSGSILLRMNGDAVDITTLSAQDLYQMRPYAQMIFQDPYSSLDPRMTVMDIIAEPIRSNKLASGSAVEARVRELIGIVGLEVQHLHRYPHAFSGGQRQRIGIARALAPSPKLIIADEPVSALDVSIQAQILNLLSDLRDQLTLTYIFISHDLRVVKHISDRIAVMYRGKIVEMANKLDLFARPLHPYTRLLLEAIPKMRAQRTEETYLEERPASNGSDRGCLFQPKCPHSEETCEREEPFLLDMGEGHFVSCHFPRGPAE